MDDRTKNLIVTALRNPDNAKAYGVVNGPNRTPANLPDQLGIRSYVSPPESPYRLPSASGQDIGGGSLDLRTDRLSLQKDGKIGNGSYYAELNKPFNGDINARLRYLLPHKNGHFEADANLAPGNSSVYVNYKTRF